MKETAKIPQKKPKKTGKSLFLLLRRRRQRRMRLGFGDFPFFLLLLLTIGMAAATFVEKLAGTEYAQQYFYQSYWFIGSWILLAILSAIYIFRKNAFRIKSALLLHCAFLVILLGALLTHLTSESGVIHLREGEKKRYFTEETKGEQKLPFQIELQQFDIEYHPGTQLPADYHSQFKIFDDSEIIEGGVSMNRIFSYKGYRFYQTSFDDDLQGSVLGISRDRWGIPVTYGGYFLLFISMIFVMLKMLKLSKEDFFTNKTGGREKIFIFLALFFSLSVFPANAADDNQTLSKEAISISRSQAEEFGKIRMLYNGRIVPLQTFAQDFTLKIVGKTSYKYVNSEQFLSGWLFFPEKWQQVALFEVKDEQLHNVLEIKKEKACFSDFFTQTGNYKLQPYYKNMYSQGKQTAFVKEALRLDEKIHLINMLHNGDLLKIFPYQNAGQIVWATPTDSLSKNLPQEQALFIRNFFPLYYAEILDHNADNALELLAKLELFQQRNGAETLLSERKRDVELFYNRAHVFSWLFMLNLTLGVIAFALCVVEILRNKRSRFIEKGILMALIAVFAILTFFFILRSYIGGYWAMSNGFETMIFIAWCALFISLILRRYSLLIAPFGLLISGFSLLVAHLGNMNPQITSLVPVLSSPLLSVHVSLIMFSYALVAFLTMSSLTVLIIILWNKKLTEDINLIIKKIHLLSKVLLYPCAFFLGVGIFVGAIWANVSWGRYWGWDPKEVWALISFIIIALPFHTKTLKVFNKPFFFHCYIFLIFASVLMTYFGVNYFLGGLHSYAGNEAHTSGFWMIGAASIGIATLIVTSWLKYRKS